MINTLYKIGEWGIVSQNASGQDVIVHLPCFKRKEFLGSCYPVNYNNTYIFIDNLGHDCKECSARIPEKDQKKFATVMRVIYKYQNGKDF